MMLPELPKIEGYEAGIFLYPDATHYTISLKEIASGIHVWRSGIELPLEPYVLQSTGGFKKHYNPKFKQCVKIILEYMLEDLAEHIKEIKLERNNSLLKR